MDTLNFDALTRPQLVELLKTVGRNIARTLSAPNAILQLRIRILADPQHREALLGATGTGIERIRSVLGALANRDFSHNAVGIPSRAGRRGRVVSSARLYALMAHAAEFDDTLLTMVPLGTYTAENIYDALVDRGVAPWNVPEMREYTSDEDRATFEVVSQMVDAYYRGQTVLAPADPTFGYEWVVDTGRSGAQYPRIMVTMPSGNVWTTPPFGLRYDRPIPMVVRGVTLTELQELAGGFDTGERPNHSDDFGIRTAAVLINHCGAVFDSPVLKGHLQWGSIANLREVIDAHGIEGLIAMVTRYFPSYQHRRTDLPDALITHIMRRNGTTAVFEGILPMMLRIPPEVYDAYPPYDKLGLPPPARPDFLSPEDRFSQAVRDAPLDRRIQAVWTGIDGIYSLYGHIQSKCLYLGIAYDVDHEPGLREALDLIWHGGVGETKAEAVPHPVSDRKVIRIEDPEAYARALGLPAPQLYTAEILRKVVRRGYKFPPLIASDAEQWVTSFDRLTPIQGRMVAGIAGKPALTAAQFIAGKVYADPAYALVTAYNPATVMELIERMTLLPPPHVQKTAYVEAELPVLTLRKDKTFNTDSQLLAAAQFHVPYTSYGEIEPYIRSMGKRNRFHLPFERCVDLFAKDATAMGVPIGDTSVFMVAYGGPKLKVWFSRFEINAIMAGGVDADKFATPYADIVLLREDINDLSALFAEAIDVFYYPTEATTYLQSIYAPFTSADEEAFDTFIARIDPRRVVGWRTHLDTITAHTNLAQWIRIHVGFDPDEVAEAIVELVIRFPKRKIPSIEEVLGGNSPDA